MEAQAMGRGKSWGRMPAPPAPGEAEAGQKGVWVTLRLQVTLKRTLYT